MVNQKKSKPPDKWNKTQNIDYRRFYFKVSKFQNLIIKGAYTLYSVIYVLTLSQASKVCSKIGQRDQFLYCLNTSADTSVVQAALAWEIIC